MTSLDATASGIQQAIDAGFDPVLRFVYRDPVDAWYNGVLARTEGGGHITPKQVFANAHATARKNLDALIERFGDRVTVDVFETRPEEAAVRISLDELRAKPQLSKEQILEAIDGDERTTEKGYGRSEPQGPGIADRGRTQGPREATGEGSTERGDPGQGRATAAPEVAESSDSSPRSEDAHIATAAQREPWEMTASEWHEAMSPAWSMSATHEESRAVVDRMYQFTRAIGEVGGPSAINPLAEKFSPEREADIRQVVVQKAVEHGKPVPRHVLEEYRGRSWADKALARAEKDIEDLRPLAKELWAIQHRVDAEVAAEPSTERYSLEAVTHNSINAILCHFGIERDPWSRKNIARIREALEPYGVTDTALLVQLKDMFPEYAKPARATVKEQKKEAEPITLTLKDVPSTTEAWKQINGEIVRQELESRKTPPPKADIERQVRDAVDNRPGGKANLPAWISALAREVPEFAADPVFTVDKDKMLVFQDGGRYKIHPRWFGLKQENLSAGQRIELDRESFGIKQPTAKALAKEAKSGMTAPELSEEPQSPATEGRGGKGTDAQYHIEEGPAIRVTGTPDPEVAKAIEKVQAKAAEWGVLIDSIDIVDEEHILTWEHDQKGLERAGITKEMYDDAVSHGKKFSVFGTHERVVRPGGRIGACIALFRDHNSRTLYHEFGHALHVQGRIRAPEGADPEQVADYVARLFLEGREEELVREPDGISSDDLWGGTQSQMGEESDPSDPTIDVPSAQGGFVGGRPGAARASISAIVREMGLTERGRSE